MEGKMTRVSGKNLVGKFGFPLETVANNTEKENTTIHRPSRLECLVLCLGLLTAAGQGTKPNIRDEKGGEWLYSPSRSCLQRSPMENRISQPDFYPIRASFCPQFTKQQRIQFSRQGSH